MLPISPLQLKQIPLRNAWWHSHSIPIFPPERASRYSLSSGLRGSNQQFINAN